MTDIFSLVGKIVIDGDNAKKELDEVSEKGEKSSSKLNGALSKIGSAAVAVGKTVAVGIGATATAIGVLSKQSIEAYGDYEQLLGGVQTLFKDSADELMNKAKTAFENQGLSANEYMETATSFSASLLQSLNNDTEQAVEYTDRAITDMADNANKMGTDIASIQNAYQGFAKQNYTMLDNLKLGYGGTKEEMQRLIQDASKMTDVQEKLGVTVDASSISFGNIVNAISVMQESMGIAGTTASEANKTIQGSLNSLKGAWSNLLVGLSDDSQDFEGLINNVVNRLITFLGNITPRIQVIFKQIPTLIQGLLPQLTSLVQSLLPPLLESAMSLFQSIAEALPDAFNTVVEMIISLFPQFLEACMTLVTSLVESLPQLVETLCQALPTLIPQIVTALVSLFVLLVNNAGEILQVLIEYLPTAIQLLLTALLENLPMILAGLVSLAYNIAVAIPEVLASILVGIIEFVANICSSIGEKVMEWWNSLSNFLQPIADWFDTNIIQPIVQFLTNLKENVANIWENIKNAFSNAIENIKTNVSDKFNSIKETITSKLTTAKENVINIFTKIKDGIKQKIESARDTVKNVIDKIKSIFNFTWSLPKLKLPHVSISGSFSLVPPSVPHFSIDWYKEGGILNDPTIFGLGKNGNLLGGGEAGAEAVAPLDTLMDYVRVAVDESNSELAERLNGVLTILSDYLPQLTERQLVLDTGVLVGELANPLDESLGVIQKRRNR